jgi:archaellum component FlaC
MSEQSTKLQAMMAQLQGALNRGTAPKPKPRMVAEPEVEVQSKRGVGPTPGKVKGIDDVDTREGTVSEIADLQRQAAQKTGMQVVAEPEEEVSGPLEDDPELAELLESLDSGSADLDDDSAVAKIKEKPADPMEAVTQQAAVTRPVEEVLDEPEEVESVPPSSMEALEGEADEAQERATAASVSAVAAQVMEQVNAAIDAKLAPLRKQLDELKASVDSAVAGVTEKMGKLAETSVGMETFTQFYEDDFAPVLEAVEKVDAMEGQVARIEEDLKGVNTELSGDSGVVAGLSKELDALRARVENDTVNREEWNEYLEVVTGTVETQAELDQLGLPALAKAFAELSAKWEELVGVDGERVPGMVHAHREASVVVAVEILRSTSEDNVHRLPDFVGDYGAQWVKDVLTYLSENPEVVRDKVALAKYNVIYSHMAGSPKLQSHKAEVDAEVNKVLGFAQQLTGDS